MSPLQNRVLLAVSAQTRQRLLPCLAGLEFVWAQTVGEVRAAAAAGRFDMVVVGSHFDESHTFDIVALVRQADPATRIVCVRGKQFLGDSTMRAFRSACEVLGVSAVIDLLDYPDDEAGNRAIRELLENRLEQAT